MVADFNVDWRARGPDGREGTVLAVTYRGSGTVDVVLLMRGEGPDTLLCVTYPQELVVATRRNSRLTDEEKELKGLLQMANRQAFLKTLTKTARQEFLKNPSAGDYWGAWKLLGEGREIKVLHETYERKEVMEMPQWNGVEARADLDAVAGRIQQALDLVHQVLTRPGIPPELARGLDVVADKLNVVHANITTLSPLAQPRPEAPVKAEEAGVPAGVGGETTPAPRGRSRIAGEAEYYLADGRGPYATIQEALDAMGVDREKRPKHNRYDRLAATWKVAIQRREKGGKGGASEAPASGALEGGESQEKPGAGPEAPQAGEVGQQPLA